MRWFTNERYADLDEGWDEMLASYDAHLSEIGPSLPPALAALAREPRLHLHDAVIRSIDIDDKARLVTMQVVAGDLQVGYRDLTLDFRRAILVPHNPQMLAYALGARYSTDHWGETTTVILAQEIDLVPSGFVLRLKLWPFYEFAIEFEGFELSEARSDPPERVPGILRHKRA